MYISYNIMYNSGSMTAGSNCHSGTLKVNFQGEAVGCRMICKDARWSRR